MSKTTQPKACMTVPEAGRHYFGLGRNASYAAANRGDLIVVEVGRLKFVPRAAMDRKLAEAGQQND
jgi:hypothetical protein